MPKIYALLVGINDYEPEVGTLFGCINDVEHFHSYLTENYNKRDLAIEVLKNRDATRANVVTTFRRHLGKAKAGDVALFQYCGHGAQWASAKAFWEFFPDRKDEGLVCVDSRSSGGYDLADKELAVLIDEIARNSPHIAIIMDCCHSGSLTRGVDDYVQLKARCTHEVAQMRPFESYLDGYYARRQKKSEPLVIPARPHILLAACERAQQAWERRNHSGVFTSALLDVLQQSGSDISYADLFIRTRHAVRKYADNQNPQFEAVENFDAYAGFLGQAVSMRRKRYFVHFDTDRWVVDFGALHGAPGEPEKAVQFSVYARDERNKPVGSGKLTLVGPQQSQLALDFEADPLTNYVAEITSLPVPPVPVYVTGDSRGVKTLRQALGPADGFALVDSPEGADYSLHAEKGCFLFRNAETGSLIRGIEGTSEGHLRRLFADIRQVVAWERGLKLQNHATKLPKDLVDFCFFELDSSGKEHLRQGEEIILDYVKEGKSWRKIRFKLKARNKTQEQLYFTLVYFSRKFGIVVLKNEPVPPVRNQEFITLFGESPDHALGLHDDADESIDTFKLIISRKQVDDFLLAQQELPVGEMIPDSRDLFGAGNRDDSEHGKYEDDWFTKMIRVRTVRQLNEVGKTPVSLVGGKVKIGGHSKIKAKVSLTASKTGTRAAGGHDIAHALERQGFELAILSSGTRATGDGASVLEITDIQAEAALADEPLRVELEIPLAENEHILPVVFDGEHFLLGAEAYKDGDGVTHLSIDHIPTIPDNRRSVGKALKLYFFKTVLKFDEANSLQKVSLNGDVRLSKSGVPAAVSKAKRVLLLLPGLAGNAKTMADGIRTAALHKHFDLVLGYEYENLNTPLAETAAMLKEALAAAGISKKKNRKVTVLAHGMGGLVARHLIEQGGGDAFVEHLVMCGTPNAGTPFGKIDRARKLMILVTTVAMSTFPAAAAVGGAILGVLNRSKQFTPTLEEMSENSAFIKALARNDDPGVRYTALAGDIAACEASSDGLFRKLLDKAGKSFVFEAVFRNAAHDLLASVESVHAIDTQRKPAPVCETVACHHLNYFGSPEGLTALKQVKW